MTGVRYPYVTLAAPEPEPEDPAAALAWADRNARTAGDDWTTKERTLLVNGGWRDWSVTR